MRRTLVLIGGALLIAGFATGLVGLGWVEVPLPWGLEISKSYWTNLSTDCIGLLIAIWIVNDLLERHERRIKEATIAPFMSYEATLLRSIQREYGSAIAAQESTEPTNRFAVRRYHRLLNHGSLDVAQLLMASDSAETTAAIAEYREFLARHTDNTEDLLHSLAKPQPPEMIESRLRQARESGAALNQAINSLLPWIEVGSEEA